MVARVILAAAVSTVAAAVQAIATPVPAGLPVAARGLHCQFGGKAIGDRVGKTYIVQELEVVSRDIHESIIGFVYSGADGVDYVDLSPSMYDAKPRPMQDGDLDRSKTMMLYCFSAPWDGKRTASP